MPRIPVRTEPYASPSRQHRHFKNKRDQVLRALGKAAYINGSHFAIMWVTASGQAETYASDAFQERLDDWFDKGGIKDEGIRLVSERNGKLSKGSDSSALDAREHGDGARNDDSDENDDDEGDEDDGSRSAVTASKNNTPLIACEDVFGPVPSSSVASTSSQPTPTAANASPSLLRASNAGMSASRGKPKPLALLDTNSTNQQFSRQLLTVPGAGIEDEKFMRAPMSAPLPNFDEQKALMRPPMVCRTGSHIGAGATKLMQVTLPDGAARTAFLELRFGQMQQGMCKTVAKAWIKIIEPKKQTRCPYNKGEEGKPKWWPEGVRHKEPDHLMKPERHALLLTILRSPKIKVARLQLATAEVVAMIRADKVNLLMDVYRIAREEERLRQARAETADKEPVSVGVSTLEGWKTGGANGELGGLDEEGKRAMMGEDTSESEEKSAKVRSDRANKKRSFAQALSRSMSTSSADKRPRCNIGVAELEAPSGLPLSGSDDFEVGPRSGKRLSAPGVVGLQRNVSQGSLGHIEGAMQRSLSSQDHIPSPASIPMSQSWSAHTPASSKGFGGNDSPFCRQIASSAAASAAAVAGLSYGASGHRGAANAVGFEQMASQSFVETESPHFLQQQGFAPDMRLQSRAPPGSMSAPQDLHASLYPSSLTPHHAQSSASASASPALNYNYQFNAQFLANPFDHQPVGLSQGGHHHHHHHHQQQHQQHQHQHPHPHGMFTVFSSENSDSGAGALGLHGLPADISNWPAFESSLVQWTASPSQQHQHNQQNQQQPNMPFHSAPARIVGLPPAIGDNSTASSAGDVSTGELSFASSAGPATPPQAASDTHSLQFQRQLQQQQFSQSQQKMVQQQQQQMHDNDFLSQMYTATPRGQGGGNFDAWVHGA